MRPFVGTALDESGKQAGTKEESLREGLRMQRWVSLEVCSC